MSQGAKFALSLIVLWIAFACFFVAFHPGGIQINGRPAQNPPDVFKYAMQKIAAGPGSVSSDSGGVKPI